MITAMDTLCTMMQTMNSSAGNAWTDASRLGYEIALEGVEDELIFHVAKQAVKTCVWRPTPSELLEMAAKLASPIPDENEMYSVICKVMERRSGYANVPKIVQDVVSALGGWWHLSYMTDAKFLRKQVIDAYNLEATRWKTAVKAQLALPEADRDAQYFPKQAKQIDQKVKLSIAS